MGDKDGFFFGLWITGKARQDRVNGQLRARLDRIEAAQRTADRRQRRAAREAHDAARTAEQAADEAARWAQVVPLSRARPYLKGVACDVQLGGDDIVAWVWLIKQTNDPLELAIEVNGYRDGTRVRTGSVPVRLPGGPEIEVFRFVEWDEAPGDVRPPEITAGIRAAKSVEPTIAGSLDATLAAWDASISWGAEPSTSHAAAHRALCAFLVAVPDADRISYVERRPQGDRMIAVLHRGHLSFAAGFVADAADRWRLVLADVAEHRLSPSARTITIGAHDDGQIGTLIERVHDLVDPPSWWSRRKRTRTEPSAGSLW